jgi:glycosyltransferase involved in cell wall biosynthesis
MTDQLVAAGVAPRGKFTTVYSGFEVEPLLEADRWRSEVRRELNLAEGDVVIGKIARLFHLKGHGDLIRAAERVIERRPNARFLLVGDGILRGRLVADVENRGLAPYFRWTGRAPPERIPPLISAMDIVVHASFREGLARVLPQALVAGRPVISYDVDGAREVVLPDVTGRLVAAGDVEALADALAELAGDRALRERFAGEGRRLMTDRFRHDRMTEALRRLYVRLLESRLPTEPPKTSRTATLQLH